VYRRVLYTNTSKCITRIQNAQTSVLRKYSHSMYSPRSLVVRRMVKGGISSLIYFGESVAEKVTSTALPKVTPQHDPYYTGDKEGTSEGGIAILSSSKARTITFFDPALKTQRCPVIARSFYSIRDLKRIIAAFIGCHVSHVDFRIKGTDISVGHYKGESLVVAFDNIRRLSSQDDVIDLYLWMDWKTTSEQAIDQTTDLDHWPEVTVELMKTYTLGIEQRTHVLGEFMSKDDTLKAIESVDISSLKSTAGRVMLTGYSPKTTIHKDVKIRGIDTRKLFELIELSDEVLAVYYRSPTKTVCKVKKDVTNIAFQAIPSVDGGLSVQLFVNSASGTGRDVKKDDVKGSKKTLTKSVMTRPPPYIHDLSKYSAYLPKTFIVEVHPDGEVFIQAIWTEIQHVVDADTRALSEIVLHRFKDIVEQFSPLEYSFPISTTTFEIGKLRSTKTQYYEVYAGGSFSKIKGTVSDLAQHGLSKIISFGEIKIVFRLPAFDSQDRVARITSRIFSKIYGNNAQLIYETDEKEMTDSAISGAIFTISTDAKTKKIRIEVEDITDEIELDFVKETTRRLVAIAGYTGSDKDFEYGGLTILNKTDPSMFGTRIGEGEIGYKKNYSRVCQPDYRHPVPVSYADSLELEADRLFRAKNLTYGGEQIYYCPSDKAKYPGFRQIGHGEPCVICCGTEKIHPESLRAREYFNCAKELVYSREDIADFESKIDYAPYFAPIAFDGKNIPEGRMTRLPPGVQDLFPSDVFIINPGKLGRKPAAVREEPEFLWDQGSGVGPAGPGEGGRAVMSGYYMDIGEKPTGPLGPVGGARTKRETAKAREVEVADVHPTLSDAVCSFFPDIDPSSLNKSLTEAMLFLSSKRIDTIIIRLRRVSKDRWTPEIVIPNHPSFSVSKDSFMIFELEGLYYPAVTEKMVLVPVPDNVLSAAKKSMATVSERIERSDYVITHEYIYEGKVYGRIVYRKKDLRSKEEKIHVSDRFFVSVEASTPSPSIPSISLQEAFGLLPSFDRLIAYLGSSKIGVVLYGSNAASGGKRDKSNNIIGLSPRNSSIVYYIKSIKSLPNTLLDGYERHVHVDTAIIDRMIAGYSKSSLNIDPSLRFDDGINTIAKYLAYHFVRSASILSIARKAKTLTEAVEMAEKEARKYVNIDRSQMGKLPLLRDNVVMMSEKPTVTEKVLSYALNRLFLMAPRNMKLLPAYFATRGCILDEDRYSMGDDVIYG
jgi:hypothetical protein